MYFSHSTLNKHAKIANKITIFGQKKPIVNDFLGIKNVEFKENLPNQGILIYFENNSTVNCNKNRKIIRKYL